MFHSHHPFSRIVVSILYIYDIHALMAIAFLLQIAINFTHEFYVSHAHTGLMDTHFSLNFLINLFYFLFG